MARSRAFRRYHSRPKASTAWQPFTKAQRPAEWKRMEKYQQQSPDGTISTQGNRVAQRMTSSGKSMRWQRESAMKPPMDWEQSFTDTQKWAKAGADRTERLLGAVAELIQRERHLSSLVEEMARELKHHLSSPRPVSPIPPQQTQSKERNRHGLIQAVCLGFVSGVFVGYLLI
jgi:hypothetical protein